MIEELFDIQTVSNQKSWLHSVDARVKLIIALAIIIAMVAIPYSALVYSVAFFFFLFFMVLWAISRLSPAIYAKRLILAIPFGIMICGFQIFFKNQYYTEYHSLVSLPFGINIYAESVQFATILLIKFLICFSFIVLLSSTTTLEDLLEAAGRMKVPPELILALGMMIRYLFVFGTMYRKIWDTLQTRLFDPFDRKLPYRYRIVHLGYIMGSMFLRSLEQGERTYISMLCRGYGRNSYIFIKRKSLVKSDILLLGAGLVVSIIVPLSCWFNK
jgi:cobalt/nickel transport system permease protein